MSDPATQPITQRGQLVKDDSNVSVGYNYTNITGQATTTIKSGAGFFHSLTINTPIATSIITIYDNTAASGTKIATITLPSTLLAEGPTTAIYDVVYKIGLTVVTGTASSDITIASV